LNLLYWAFEADIQVGYAKFISGHEAWITAILRAEVTCHRFPEKVEEEVNRELQMLQEKAIREAKQSEERQKLIQDRINALKRPRDNGNANIDVNMEQPVSPVVQPPTKRGRGRPCKEPQDQPFAPFNMTTTTVTDNYPSLSPSPSGLFGQLLLGKSF
jgi:hypothetical protein